MALGALLSSYKNATGGEGDLVSTLPLAGRTLVEYQARLARAAGAAPIVLLAERTPPSLLSAMDRLVKDGIAVQLVRSTAEAARFFAPNDAILLIADGLYADAETVERVAGAPRPTVLTIADEAGLDRFERIDAERLWGGLALSRGSEVAATVEMLGDWDLHSTLLRRMVQNGAAQLHAEANAGAPFLVMAQVESDLEGAQRRMVAGARGARGDWVERHVTPIIETFAVRQLMTTGVRPIWLLAGALMLTVAAAVCIVGGWRGLGLAALLIAMPLDSIGQRLAALRMQPLQRNGRLRRALPYAAAAALAALGIDLAAHEGGWGSLVAAIGALGFLRAQSVEISRSSDRAPAWIASRKGCTLLATPFALTGAWTLGLVAIAAYAAGSFLWLQQMRAKTETLSER